MRAHFLFQFFTQRPKQVSFSYSLYTLVISFVFSISLTACGGSQTEDILNDLPAWAMNPPAACALGSISFQGNLGLAKSAAMARGRDALARQIQTKVEGLIKDYQSQGETDGQQFVEEQITQVSRQSVRQSLGGSRLKKWSLSKGKKPSLYALVCLQPEEIAKAFDKMSQFTNKQRVGLKKRAKEVFGDLDQEMKKY